MNPPPERWRRCSTCKRDIGFNTIHWTCSVSTCNRARSALQFCSVGCWDSHVPILRHRDAWAVEVRSPTREQAEKELAAARPADPRPAPREVRPPAPSARPAAAQPTQRPAPSPSSTPTESSKPMAESEDGESLEHEILIVVSKLKKYVRARSGFNTSDGCMELLSDHVRAICDRAIATARENERKTLLARDIPKVTS